MNSTAFTLRWPCDPNQGQDHWKRYKIVQVDGAYKQDRYEKI